MSDTTTARSERFSNLDCLEQPWEETLAVPPIGACIELNSENRPSLKIVKLGLETFFDEPYLIQINSLTYSESLGEGRPERAGEGR